jgi:CRISPR/Cas system-associated protein endoribonuclease Cas2
MKTEEKIIKPYFSHDYSPRADKKILKLFISMGAEGYGLFWLIIEYMHQNDFAVEDEELLAYDFRTTADKIHKIMNEFDLFYIENGYYMSARVLRNLNYVEQKNEDKRQAANVRWLLSAFNKSYKEFFGSEPILQPNEIESLKKYNEKIPNLREQLRDILYTLKNLKFDTDINFKPCANWLLADNNLARLVNGEFGKLKHKKTAKELKEEQKQLALLEQKKNQPDEIDIKCQAVTNREDAIQLLLENIRPMNNGRLFIIPTYQAVMDRFGISNSEIKELINGNSTKDNE